MAELIKKLGEILSHVEQGNDIIYNNMNPSENPADYLISSKQSSLITDNSDVQIWTQSKADGDL